jgi:hypothetical protein
MTTQELTEIHELSDFDLDHVVGAFTNVERKEHTLHEPGAQPTPPHPARSQLMNELQQCADAYAQLLASTNLVWPNEIRIKPIILAAGSKHLIGFRRDRREAVFVFTASHFARFRLWHKMDVPKASPDVRFRG